MRHVVSAYVSKSRCGSTTEASLGGTENLASSFGFPCQTPEPPAHEAMRESALNSQVPALSVPPRRPPRQAPMFKREFYFNDLSFGEKLEEAASFLQRYHRPSSSLLCLASRRRDLLICSIRS